MKKVVVDRSCLPGQHGLVPVLVHRFEVVIEIFLPHLTEDEIDSLGDSCLFFKKIFWV